MKKLLFLMLLTGLLVPSVSSAMLLFPSFDLFGEKPAPQNSPVVQPKVISGTNVPTNPALINLQGKTPGIKVVGSKSTITLLRERISNLELENRSLKKDIKDLETATANLRALNDTLTAENNQLKLSCSL